MLKLADEECRRQTMIAGDYRTREPSRTRPWGQKFEQKGLYVARTSHASESWLPKPSSNQAYGVVGVPRKVGGGQGQRKLVQHWTALHYRRRTALQVQGHVRMLALRM